MIKRYGIEGYNKHLLATTLTKEEFISKHGIGAWNKKLEQGRVWRVLNPIKVKENNHELGNIGGKYYEKNQFNKQHGLRHEKELIRMTHRNLYRPFKRIISPETQIHHEWIPGTSDYTGVALVEKDPHMHGFIDVIQILEGEITLLTEMGVRG